MDDKIQFRLPQLDCGKLTKIAKKIDDLTKGLENPKPENVESEPGPKPDPLLNLNNEEEIEEEEEDDEEEEWGENENEEEEWCPPPKPKPPCASELRDCRICRRTFPLDRIEGHEIVCEASKNRKRDERRALSKPSTEIPPESLLQQFEAIKLCLLEEKDQCKYQRDVAKYFKNLPPPPNKLEEDCTQCRKCGRRFSTTSFEKHDCGPKEPEPESPPKPVAVECIPDVKVFGIPKPRRVTEDCDCFPQDPCENYSQYYLQYDDFTFC